MIDSAAQDRGGVVDNSKRRTECEMETELKESSNKLIKIESAVRPPSERHTTDAILSVRDT